MTHVGIAFLANNKSLLTFDHVSDNRASSFFIIPQVAFQKSKDF